MEKPSKFINPQTQAYLKSKQGISTQQQTEELWKKLDEHSTSIELLKYDTNHLDVVLKEIDKNRSDNFNYTLDRTNNLVTMYKETKERIDEIEDINGNLTAKVFFNSRTANRALGLGTIAIILTLVDLVWHLIK